MIENTDDKKKAAISETGDKKMPAKHDYNFVMNNCLLNCMIKFYFCIVKMH